MKKSIQIIIWIIALLSSFPSYSQIKFRQQLIASESAESVGVFDVNNDRVLDIVSGSYWYAGPLFLKRNLIFNQYYDNLKDIPGIIFQPISDWAIPSKWLYCILINEKEFGCSRDTLILSLKEFNVDTRPFFIPLHKLPPFKKEGVEKNVKLPVTEELSECGINLPTYNKLSDIEIVYICNVIRSIHNSYLNARI
jgi:hypothetical protein